MRTIKSRFFFCFIEENLNTIVNNSLLIVMKGKKIY